VSAKGADEGDFVFLLGFPASTMCYAPASCLEFSDEVEVPALVRDFGRKFNLILEHEKASPEAALKLLRYKKGLSNELKHMRGKLVMMKKLQLVKERSSEEADLVKKAGETAETA